MCKTIKIFLDDEPVIEIPEWQFRALCHDIPEEIVREDLSHRMRHIVRQKINESISIIRKEWAKDLDLPSDAQEMCKMVFSQESYASRRQKEQYKKLKETEHLWACI